MARVSAEGRISARGTSFERARSGIGFFAGPLLFLLVLLLPTPDAFWREAEAQAAASPAALETAHLAFSMKVTLALLVLMVTWWVTEAVPLPVTALLPGIILPLFQVIGVQDGRPVELNGRAVLAHYANPVIFLFLSGFLIAGAMQKWGLDRRIALWILTRGNIAASPGKILLSLMGASAFLSMWVSNTATTAMMLPIGFGILSRVSGAEASSNYARALLLGIAYAASIGGVGTIIGTPPNGIAVSILRQQNVAHLDFLEWMAFGLPFVLLAVPLAWFVLRVVFPFNFAFDEGVRALLQAERAALGPLGRGERLTLFGFLLAVVLWTTHPFWSLLPGLGQRLAWFDEHLIALSVAILLFLLPVDWKQRRFVLQWEDSRYVDWGTLLLFGGGLALSDAMFKTGLARVFASEFIALFGRPSPLVLVFMIVLFMDLLTEVSSNTAVTSMIVPILISMASGLGAEATTLVLPATVAASMAFMLPVATPPNALVYATRRVGIVDMLRAGIALDIAAWLYIVAFFYGYVASVLGLIRF
ncbi:MAG: DASS family sodium-coupled anion symporter [Blastocatellia bacterium]|nr:DASS family sodium-coupled anion symporter [Blastocatellia bacterium]MCS7156595.1 DASS family sodium-coupled anion symporter [Blastocatellia bacterium]MCX7751663.1 DASS family sodium-coupled anion symporter [Blastocatellia bacterium]MDW8168763.1 DASS family sodium-coupled anion symporter [Acidobacteriota bacterium]MDW8257029.1 DASS family sodium-coupled anion symporter [Acidobacteriota bacterium]